MDSKSLWSLWIFLIRDWIGLFHAHNLKHVRKVLHLNERVWCVFYTSRPSFGVEKNHRSKKKFHHSSGGFSFSSQKKAPLKRPTTVRSNQGSITYILKHPSPCFLFFWIQINHPTIVSLEKHSFLLHTYVKRIFSYYYRMTDLWLYHIAEMQCS